MTAPVGQIRFDVDVDASGLAATLRTQLAPARVQVQRQLQRTPLRVPITIDTQAAVRVAQRQLNASRLTVNATLNINTNQAVAQARATLSGTTLTVPVEIDSAAMLAQAVALRGQLASILGGPITQRVTVDVDRSVAASLAGISTQIRSIGSAGADLTGTASRISAIGGAASLAAGAVGGLAAGLLAIGPAAAGVIGSLSVGLQGVVDTFTALSAVSENSASEARDQADQLATANDQLASALDSVESAQTSLTSAHRAQADAAEDVAQAYQDAQRDLENYRFTVAEASLDEREAALAVADAQRALAEAGFDPRERERALLRLQRAELRHEQATERNTEVQQEADQAQRAGVEGSERVISAKERQAQADEQAAAASRGLEAAQRQLAAASRAVEDASSGATTSVAAFNDALARLAPNAQAFVLAARDLAPAWDAVGTATQDALFADLGDTLREQADTILPALQEGLVGVAGLLGEAANQALEFLGSARGVEGINVIFGNTQELLRGLGDGTGQLTQGFLDFNAAAAPVMRSIGGGLAYIGDSVGRVFSEFAATGELTTILQGFSTTLVGVGNAVGGLVDGLLTVARDVLPELQPLLTSLGDFFRTIGPSVGAFGAEFARSFTDLLPDLARFVSALVDGLTPVLPVISSLLSAIGRVLEPLIEPFSRLAVVIGNALTSALNELDLTSLANAFVDLVTAVSPILPVLAQLATTVLNALAPALSEIFTALAPVITTLAEEFRPILAQLGPILADVAGDIGTGLAEAIKVIAPLLPDLVRSFGELVISITPLIPALVDLALRVLPILANILVAVIPHVISLMDNSARWANEIIIPVLVPALNFLADVVTGVFGIIRDQVNFVTDTVFPKLGTALETVKGWFSGAVDFIGSTWARISRLTATPINFVINTVWNNGLLKAWQSVDNLLGGILPDAAPLAPIPGFAVGGPIRGAGTGTSDDILAFLSNGEHVVTAAEVAAAGGQNVLLAIRDMIARGIPFTWAGGQLISELGRSNLNAYGAAVGQQGIGNVDPQGLFDPVLPRGLLPGFATGGPVMPWMNQLKAGHDFARAQNGKDYQWGGPTGPGSSFDCSGLMGSIAAAILGLDPWTRYWATSSFGRSQRQVGPQGFTAGIDAGFSIGVTDDPNGPGGGHTAGTLGALPLLGVHSPVNVESGGTLGNVHYGGGPDPRSFLTQYHLPIGANGFFQPGAGGATVGPSTESQSGFIRDTIARIIRAATDPVRAAIESQIGLPPPSIRGIPLGALNASEQALITHASNAVGNLGGSLGGIWQRAQGLGGNFLDLVNPFDNGGIAAGTGIMRKDVIAPERVLSPEQTRLFETLVVSLQSLATSGLGATAGPNPTVEIASDSIAAIGRAVGIQVPDGTLAGAESTFQDTAARAFTEAGQVLSNTQSLVQRTESSFAIVAEQRHQQVLAVLGEVARQLTDQVLIPTITAALDAALRAAGASQAFSVLGRNVGQVAGDIIARAVAIASAGSGAVVAAAGGGVLPGYTPGRDVHRFWSPTAGYLALSGGEAIMRPEWTRAIGGPSAVAALNRAAIRGFAGGGVMSFATGGVPDNFGSDLIGVDGQLGIAANVIVSAILQVAGIEIEIRNALIGVAKDVREFRGDAVSAFDENGQLISDTSALIERTETSSEIADAERDRIMREIIAGILKFLIITILIPVLSAILTSLITLATAAIGTAIAGPVGTVIGAAVGAALGGLASIAVAAIGAVLVSGIDAVFDDGGIANGVGFMPKNTLAPERVLSPRQTDSFDRLVNLLDRGGLGSRTTQIGSINISGRDPAQRTADNLLALLPN